jgi:hypothetical protein
VYFFQFINHSSIQRYIIDILKAPEDNRQENPFPGDRKFHIQRRANPHLNVVQLRSLRDEEYNVRDKIWLIGTVML